MPGETERTSVMLGRLESKIDTLGAEVKKLNEKLYGNGTPGIIIDQERQTAEINKLVKIAETNQNNIKALQDSVGAKWVADHWKEVALMGVFTFVLLHSLLPPELTVWALLSKIIGGP